MRKTMNLKAMIAGQPLNESLALGDDVTVGRDDEDKREGVVKVPHGPGDTAGVLVDGELEMVPAEELSRKRTDESNDLNRARRAMLDARGTSSYKALRDRYLEMKDRKTTTEEFGFTDSDDEEEDDTKAKAQERAQARADYADDYGDEASDDYLREGGEVARFEYRITNGAYFRLQPLNDAATVLLPKAKEVDPGEMLELCQQNPTATFAHLDSEAMSAQEMIDEYELEDMMEGALNESFIMGMTAMPSLARMQALAGIRTEGALPDFLQKDDEDAEEDDQAEETETEQTDDAEPEAETDDEAEESEADTVEQPEQPEAGQPEAEVEVAIVADPEPAEEVVQAAEDMEAAVEAQPVSELGANHPASAGEVQMMSAPAPVEAFPEQEEAAPEPEALDVCMKAIGDLEQQLPNISVRDFAEISKRLQAVQSSLFEGHTGRKLKEGEEFDSYSIEMKDSPRGEKYAVYGFGTYGRSSVLAGQTRKQFITWFDSEEEAKAAYPQAEIGYRSAHNSYSHLPGEDDPVAGGMYPDDIDDGY